MPNVNRPNGLSPVKHLVSGNYNGQANIYSIAATNVSGFAIGDPVISSGSSDARGVPGIALASGISPLRGVILGLGTGEGGIFNPLNLNSTTRPAVAQSTYWYAMVADDPSLLFTVQEVGTGTSLLATSVGLNANLLLGTNNGFSSGWQLSNVGAATTATLQVKLLGLSREPNNSFGPYAKWLVMINNHEFSAGTVGV